MKYVSFCTTVGKCLCYKKKKTTTTLFYMPENCTAIIGKNKSDTILDVSLTLCSVAFCYKLMTRPKEHWL